MEKAKKPRKIWLRNIILQNKFPSDKYNGGMETCNLEMSDFNSKMKKNWKCDICFRQYQWFKKKQEIL